MKRAMIASVALCILSTPALADATVVAGPVINTRGVDDIDFVLKAKPHQNKLKAPSIRHVRPDMSQSGGNAGLVAGAKIGAKPRLNLDGTALPQDPGNRAFGSHGIPYTSTRVQDGGSSAAGATPANFLSTTWPYGAIGKMVFTTPFGNSFCSASVIRRGLVVTAAHCVQDFGTGGAVFTNFVFRPGHFGAAGATTAQIQPYGDRKSVV